METTLVDETNDPGSPLKVQFTDAILIILIGLFALVAYVRISGKNYLRRIFTSITNFSYSNSFFKEKNLAYALNNSILQVVFFLSTGLLINVAVDYFQLNFLTNGNWNQIALYILITMGLLLIYRFAYRFLGLIIGNRNITSEYLFFFSNLLKILGIINVILLFGSYFTSNSGKTFFIYLAIFITIFTYFVKVYRIFVIIFKNRFSLYYMILYFCALEIIPIMLLVKILWLINHGENTLIDLLV